jgi:hypothetical protein
MKLFLRIILSVVGVAALLVLIAFADGATLPIDHSVSVSGTVAAPPTEVFARITDIANGAAWRPQVKSIKVLPKDYGHGQEMRFLATTSAPPKPYGPNVGPETVVAKRIVQLDDAGAQYGGKWTYELSPTRTNMGDQATLLKITEDGYIKPPIYRFVMAHIMGPTKNLDDYLKDIQVAFPKP